MSIVARGDQKRILNFQVLEVWVIVGSNGSAGDQALCAP